MESFFKACENGKISEAKTLLTQLDQSSLEGKKMPDGRTCFHMAVISGDADLVNQLTERLRHYGLSNIIRMTDEKGDTALHLAVREDRVGIARQLVDLDTSFCECANKRGETPLKLAASLGFREAVEFLVTRTTSNALHYIVELNQVKLVKYLIKMSGKEDKLKLSKLINEHYEPAPNPPDQKNSATNSTNPSDKENSSTKPTNPPDNEGNRAANPQNIQPIDKVQQDPEEKSPTNSTATDAKDDQPIVRRGDTPLHIAARNKYGDMVNLLLKVDGVNRRARNSEGKTPFEIAREVTEYHESFRIIRKLEYYGRKPKPFMYCAPQVSREKYKNARSMVNKAYEERRNAELVVAALLAAMTCAAAFTVPGGFNSESSVKENGGSPIPSPAPSPSNVEDDLGTPLLISLISFKLFIIFDCIAFFLALFVCIMWEMSCELTTGDKMLFMTVNSLVVCCSFGFTAYGFMSAVYAMLARKVKTFSWVVLGSLIAITACGVLAFIRQSIHFAVTRARFHRLCGVSCFVDDIVEKVWCAAERCGLLKLVRSSDDVSRDLISGLAALKSDDVSRDLISGLATVKSDDVSRDLISGLATIKSDDDRTNNSQSSPSCCCNHV